MVNNFYLKGLTQKEVEHKVLEGKVNTNPEQITKSVADIIKDNVFTLFNAYNVIIAILLIAVGAYSNLLFIFIIILNVSIGIFQELQAKRLVEELSLVSAPKIHVIRDGEEQSIPTEELVLGDIVKLKMGNQVPVDCRLVHGTVEVNESLLTGEPDNIQKRIDDRLYSGSYIASGKAYVEAIAVGSESYANKIAKQAKAHKVIQSEFKSSMKKVTNLTSFLIIPLGIALFLEAYFLRSDDMKTSVVATSAALLGMLPKGLLLFVSLALASGVIKLSKKKVLIQEMHVLETLSHVDVLCLDKTGTITEGKMQVTNVELLGKGTISELEAAMPKILGAIDDSNATFLALAKHFGKQQAYAESVISFSSDRKWSGATIDQGTFIIGAPERVFPSIPREKIETAMSEGSRLIVFAQAQQKVSEQTNLQEVLIKPIALITLKDPIRKNAKQTLGYFANEGVEIKIISGDHPLTVASIAEQAGVVGSDRFVDMSIYETREEVMRIVDLYQVFGRVSPEQKKWLVEGLQQRNHTVAMTGDGVNDVLALKQSECSIAMAEGSDVTKQVASLVLLESDFSVLPDTLLEGRRVVNNVTNAAAIFFVKTIYSVLLSIICIITNTPFPFQPVQITLIDLAIEGYPSFFMSFQSNPNRVVGQFLPSVLERSTPAALLIIINMLWMQAASIYLQIPEGVLITAMYYMIAFVTILIAINVLRPFNAWKLFLAVTMTIGFFGATIIFYKLLHLTMLNQVGMRLFAVAALSSIILLPMAMKISKNVFNKITWKIN